MTDDQMLANFLSHRDDAAFEGVVRRHGPMVFRVCREVLGDLEDAEDAFQATFLVLVRQAKTIRDRDSLGRWLYEVANRISRRERRRVARVRFQERQVPAMDLAATADGDPGDREVRPILHDEIRLLPSKLRDAIVLCYFEGLTVEEAARRLKCPVGTLKSRLGKGRELLRSRLTRRGLAASALLLLMFSMTEEVTAAVPPDLVLSTVEAGRIGLDGTGVSTRIASMVFDEEIKARWASKLTTWSRVSILLLLLSFGIAWLCWGGDAQAGGIRPVVSWLTTIRTQVAQPPSPNSPDQPPTSSLCHH